MSLYSQFKTNADLEREGILLEYGTASNGKPIAIRIARAGGSNVMFQKRAEALVKPMRRQIQTETADDKQIQRVMRQLYAETVVLGWENVELPVVNEDGSRTGAMQFVPYTVANCIKLFEDLPDLFTDLQEQAQRSALFRQTILEAEAGN